MKLKTILFALGFAALASITLARPAAAQSKQPGIIYVSGVRYTGYKVVSGNDWEVRTCLGNRISGSQPQASDHPKASFQPGNVHCTTSASASSAVDADGDTEEQHPAETERDQLAKLPK
jgi:hypothetical protein